MLRADYQIRFNCPAFLGDAEQQSAWRTPPFKALLQHWWRIAVAKQHNYDWHQVREAEGRLFGHAWLDKGSWAMRSRVRIKLEHQNRGTLTQWENSPANNKVTHPEVKDRNTGKLRPMAPENYLAYGPLHFRDGLVHTPAIKAEEKNQLTLIYPKEDDATFEQVMQLIHWFGTLGGRSRNGWGSVGLEGERIEQNLDIERLNFVSRPLPECLNIEWPHAIGYDNQGLLIWQTPQRANWQQVVKDLAQAKIKLRTDLQFPASRPGNFEKRHLLAYPVTNHKVNEWGSNGRLANQVRFKVVQKDSQFMGIIVHLPCGLPKEMTQALRNPPSIQEQMNIWESVHQSLDGLKQSLGITRINS
ncbi:MAG TPA: hypothetical protein DCZ48_09805 [Methylococcaceae bacterium]|nr:hypothetical protein [Methylococcaceae bacterium]